MPTTPAPPTVIGHVTAGFGNLGVSLWFVLYGLVVVLGLTILAVRARPVPTGGDGGSAPPPAADETASDTGRADPPTWATALAVAARTLGLVLFAVVLAAALAGDPAGGSNPAPLTVFVAFFMGLAVLSLLVGDIWAWLSPFTTIAMLIDRVRGDWSEPAVGAGAGIPDTTRDWWVPAVLLFSFETWWLVVVHGTRPRVLAVWLVGFTVVMIAGAVAGGQAWCRRNDPFAVLFAAFASLAPVELGAGRPRWNRPMQRLSTDTGSRRTAGVLAVLIGSIAFDHAASSTWWVKTVNGLGDTAFTAVNAAGLAWCIGLVAVAWIAASRLAGHRADAGGDGDEPDLIAGLAPALRPLAAGLFLAYALPRLLIDLQNVAALSSDPFGRGWDLFGTLGLVLNEQPIGPGVAGWLQVGFIAVGAVATIAALYRRLGTTIGRRFQLASPPLLVFVLVVTLGGVRLVLGA